MAGFNPFAPQMEKKQGSPQLQGVQAPNTPMQDKPGFMDKYGPSIASAAMSSDAAGAMGDSVTAGAKDVWSSLTTPSTMGSAVSPSAMAGGGAEGAIAAQQAAAAGTVAAGETALMGAAPVGLGTMASGGAGALAAGGAEGAIAAEVAAAAATEAAAATALTGAATAGTAGAVAGAAPLALAAGPFAPLVLGGMMLAANSGK